MIKFLIKFNVFILTLCFATLSIAQNQNVQEDKTAQESKSTPADKVIQADLNLNEVANKSATAEQPSEIAQSVAKTESEIPLSFEEQKSNKAEGSSLFRMLMTLSVIGLSATAAVFFFRKNGFKNTKLKQNQIKVLTQYHLGPKKSLAIVRVAGESILVGITDHSINHIKTLSLLDEDIPETTPHQFQDLMANQTQDKVAVKSDRSMALHKVEKEFDEQEEFTMGGLKEVLTKKMKNMRTLQ